jgi:hypothetical protein
MNKIPRVTILIPATEEKKLRPYDMNIGDSFIVRGFHETVHHVVSPPDGGMFGGLTTIAFSKGEAPRIYVWQCDTFCSVDKVRITDIQVCGVYE